MSRATRPRAPRTSLEALPAELAGRRTGRWDLSLQNGRALRVAVSASESWVQLDTPLTVRRSRGCAWRWLRANLGLPGGVKIALDESLRPRLRAELPRASGSDLSRHLAPAAQGFRAALGRLRGRASKAAPPPPVEVTDRDLGPLCGESVWPFRAGSTTVALDVPDASLHAGVSELVEGGLLVSVSLETWPAAKLPEVRREALGLLLLSVSGMVRLVRASASAPEDDRFAVSLDVHLPSDASPGELADALSALSLGGRLCAAEVRALESEDVAEEYLKLRGWSS